ncbi:MAG: hypothetical protein GY702_13730, partial [Desulfobulbaceae bacterium]|nr:hypothetical protein [Desulfobulbaceae bacterium]
MVGNTWSYTLDNMAVQALDAGQSLTDTFTFWANDTITSQTVTVTINGAEDAPSITGTVVGTVAEDGTLTDGAALTITDADTNDNPISFNNVAATAGDNGFGNFTMIGNTWTYTLDNNNLAVQALDAGETLTDTFTFWASDTTTSQTVTVTINGAEDAPSISGTVVGTVVEDGTLTDGAALSITDVDTNDNPISFNNVATTAGDNGYGDFTMVGNTWSYTLDNMAVQALDAGQSLTDTFTFWANDTITSQTVTVTIN